MAMFRSYRILFELWSLLVHVFGQNMRTFQYFYGEREAVLSWKQGGNANCRRNREAMLRDRRSEATMRITAAKTKMKMRTKMETTIMTTRKAKIKTKANETETKKKVKAKVRLSPKETMMGKNVKMMGRKWIYYRFDLKQRPL